MTMPQLTKIKEIQDSQNYMINKPPINLAGRVEDMIFVNCVFGPACLDIQFLNCEFTNCHGMAYLEVI
jgi:hypothetical protein